MLSVKKYEPWLIFFGSLGLFLYGLFGRELIGSEAHVAVYVQEMQRLGPKFFPETYDKALPFYPGSSSFLIYLFSLATGKLTTLTAVLPSALAASGSLVLMYNITSPIDRNWARISVLLALCTYQFFDSARCLSSSTLILFTGIWAFYLCLQSSSTKYLLFPLIFAFFVQGPTGFVTPLFITLSFFVARAHWNTLKLLCKQSACLFLVLGVLLMLEALYQGGFQFAMMVMKNTFLPLFEHHNIISLMIGLFSNDAISFELALMGILCTFNQRTENNAEVLLIRSLILWIIFILAGILVIGGDRTNSFLALVPPCALIGGRLWYESANNYCARLITAGFHFICLVLPFVGICLTIATIVSVHLKGLAVNAHYFSAFCTLILLALASIAIFWHHPMSYARHHPKRVIGIGLASFLVAMIFVVKPIEVSLSESKPFTVKVLIALAPTQSLTFYQMNPKKEPLLFEYALPENTHIPIYFSQYLDPTANTLYLTTAKNYDALSTELKQKTTVVVNGHLGYHDMVALKVEH